MNRREGDRSKHREGKDESPSSQVVQTPPVIAGQESRKPAKTSRCSYGYRLKALAEIRNSLLPFATGDPTELSSASSSTASECGSGQLADAGANGLDCNTQYGCVREEEQAPHIAKFSGAKSIDFVNTEVKSHTFHSSSGCQKQDKINGLTRSNLGAANLKHVRKGNLQDGCSWEIPQRLSENSSSSARSDSPSVSITGLQHQILPDPPRLVSGNGGHISENPCHNHVQLARQQSPGFSPNDMPPPLPPPRVVAGPTTPPLSQSQYSSMGAANNAQHYYKRASPIPHSAGQQIINSSTSSPQRGASPVSSGRSPLMQLTMAQAKQQLVQQLQNLAIYSNNGLSTQQDLPPPYPTSLYSSPPPLYKSSSSGKQSPTPTVSSSSEYSSPPASQKKCLPSSFTPPPSTNCTQSQQVFSFPVTSISPYSCASSTSVSTTVARPSSLQAWSARQAKSQSPVIMQSVKSTQVQKPVLQTAVAPPPPSITCATHSVSFIQPPSSSNQLPACVAFGRAQIGHMLPYPSVPGVPNYSSNMQNTVDTSTQLSPSSSPTPDLYHAPIANPFYPPNLNTHPSHSMLQQVQIYSSYNTPFSSSVLSSANPVLPPPYTTSAHQHTGASVPPPCYSAGNESQAVITNVAPTPHMHSKQKQKAQQGPAMVITSVHNQPTAIVPTTDPPSYATSIAALAAQKAAVSVLNNNLPTVACENLPKTTSSNNETSSHVCNLVNTVESICASQVMALSDANSNLRGNLDVQGESLSYMLHSPLQRKPSPISMDTGSSASRSESPISRGLSQSPISSMSTTSTSSPSVQSDLTQDSKKVSPSYKLSHQSPIPPRKVLSKEKEDERQESKVKNYSPAAYKFFMEQHVENILKFQQQRQHRRQQLETEMVKVGLSDEAQHQMRKMLHQKESNYIRLKRAKMDKAMFTKIKTIGLGAFGEVALVRKVVTNHLYAMKTLRKSDVLKRNQVAHVKAERDILAEADNEWVVKLYYSFQDQDNLYFVMDYIPGGDLMSLLIKFGVFQEPLARFYIGELVLAVESVHKMGFIHRDIKPDNILIDRDGHIKLTDFGLCTGFRWTHNSKYYQSNGEHGRQDSTDSEEKWSNKCHCKSTANLKPLERRRRREHQRCLAHSLVGTPNYIAPEVLMRLGYTQLCDWWSVGVILYEMLVGQPPFLASTPAETQYKVINWETTLHIPKAANLSLEAADLTLKLCCGPDKRLGRNGADDIKKHPFFNSIDFEGGLRKQRAPYLPSISHPTDTSNFDPIDIDKLRNSNSSSSDESRSEDGCDNGKHSEHAFFEFTFRRFFDDGGQAYPVRISLDENDGQSSPVYV